LLREADDAGATLGPPKRKPVAMAPGTIALPSRLSTSLCSALALPTWRMTALTLATLVLMTAWFFVVKTYGIYHGQLSWADWAWGFWEWLWRDSLVALAMLWRIGAVAQRGPQHGTRRVLAMAAAVLAAGFVCVLSTLAYLVIEGEEPVSWEWSWALAMVPLKFTLLAALLTAAGEIYRWEVRSLQAMRAAEADRAALERETLQARLQVLQAQIEPHFLFNTLANVRRLYELDRHGGRTMLEQLMRYLEVALPSMRAERSTLGREAALIDAYLHLQQVRMGRRLVFDIDIAAPLRGIEVPPMMLLTLVENAIKHGLAPLREGGRIDIAARARDGRLALTVIDNGRGFGGDTAGGGTGLANIRARLAALHGAAARLDLAANPPRGVRADIVLPLPEALE
jgi:sensor histidine kinase YesM